MIKVNKEMAVEDVLEALRTLELLGSTISDEAVSLAIPTPDGVAGRAVEQEELVRRLEQGVKLKRKPVRKRKSWQAKRKTKKLRKQREYQNRSARRNAEWAEMLNTRLDPELIAGLSEAEAENVRREHEARVAESWYRWFSRVSNTSWATKKGWEISKDEYAEFIHPALRGRVPTVQRYDTKKPWSMKNTLWVDTETRAVLFDGATHFLIQQGYVVDPSLNPA
jgi:exonuclease VII large subunit